MDKMDKDNENIINNLAEKFGGVANFSRLLDISAQTIYSWKRVGLIPAKYHVFIMKAAAERGKVLTLKDFYKQSDLDLVAKIQGESRNGFKNI